MLVGVFYDVFVIYILLEGISLIYFFYFVGDLMVVNLVELFIVFCLLYSYKGEIWEEEYIYWLNVYICFM